MKIVKNLIAVLLCAVTVSLFFVRAFADGNKNQEAVATALDADNEQKEASLTVTAENAVLFEAVTGTIIYNKSADERAPVSYLTKLMTILLTVEKLETDKSFTLDKKLITSSEANSKQGSQIWLNIGEEITVQELLKSITIGNANDACTVLAEGISGSEEAFVSEMNNRAKKLGMNDTSFVDCTGISDSNISTAKDIAVLSSELLKHESLKAYFTTWMDTVREGKAELVNLNTLVKNYNGISGLKACASEKAGNCIAASADRNKMNLVAVALNSKDNDSKASDAKALLDFGFDNYDMFIPEISEDVTEDINVIHGSELKTSTYIDGTTKLVIKRGTAGDISVDYNRVDKIEAPVKKNTKVGELVFYMGTRELMKHNIYTEKDVERIDLVCAYKKLLLSLLRN